VIATFTYPDGSRIYRRLHTAVRGLAKQINGTFYRPLSVTFDFDPQTKKQEQWMLYCQLACAKSRIENDYLNPSMELILQAVPMLQWRRCFDCKAELLYRDNMLPACACHKCGSDDTRIMTAANRLLHRMDVVKKDGVSA
jgi:hypothetical protein